MCRTELTLRKGAALCRLRDSTGSCRGHTPLVQRASLTWVLIFFTDKIVVSVVISHTVSTIALVSKILFYF